MDTIQQLELLFEQLLRAGRNILATSEPGPDREILEHKLSDTTNTWHTIKKEAVDRQDLLNQVVPLAKTFHSVMKDFNPWLTDTEKRLRAAEPLLCQQESITKNLKTVLELKEEISDHKGDLVELEKVSLCLLDCCSADKFVIEGTMQEVNKRYEELSDGASALKDKLVSLNVALERYHMVVAPVEELLNNTQKVLESRQPTGININQGKDQLTKIEELLTSLKESEPGVKTVSEASDQLISALDPKSLDVARLKHDERCLAQRHTNLQEDIKASKTRLESEVERATKFHDALSDLFEWLGNMQETVTAQDPISSDPELVKQQLQEAEVWPDSFILEKLLPLCRFSCTTGQA